jgi:hypothetical protein
MAFRIVPEATPGGKARIGGIAIDGGGEAAATG